MPPVIPSISGNATAQQVEGGAVVVEALPSGRKFRRVFDSVRTKLSEILDDSRVYRRRAGEDGEARAGGGGGNGINVPASAVVGFVMYLVVSAAGGIWWAATMQAKLDNLAALYGQLWQKTETQEILINKLENGLDERVRVKSREVLTDWGYIHVPRKGQD